MRLGDQLRAAGTGFDQRGPPQDQGARDALAQIGLGDQHRTQLRRRHQDGVDIDFGMTVDQRMAAGQLADLGQELTRTLPDDRSDMAETVALIDRHHAFEDDEHARGGRAGREERSTALVVAHAAEPADAGDLGLVRHREHLIVPIARLRATVRQLKTGSRVVWQSLMRSAQRRQYSLVCLVPDPWCCNSCTGIRNVVRAWFLSTRTRVGLPVLAIPPAHRLKKSLERANFSARRGAGPGSRSQPPPAKPATMNSCSGMPPFSAPWLPRMKWWKDLALSQNLIRAMSYRKLMFRRWSWREPDCRQALSPGRGTLRSTSRTHGLSKFRASTLHPSTKRPS